MLGSLSVFVLAILPLAYAQDIDTNTVVATLKSTNAIPDVIPANFTPRFAIEVVFTDANHSQFPVTAGANLTIGRSSLFHTFKPTFAHNFVQKPPTNLHSPFCPTTLKSSENHTSWP